MTGEVRHFMMASHQNGIYAVHKKSVPLSLFFRYVVEFSRNTQSWEVGIFVLLNIESKMDRKISHFNFNSNNYAKYINLL